MCLNMRLVLFFAGKQSGIPIVPALLEKSDGWR